MKVREEGILLTELDNVFIIQRIDSEAQVCFRKAGVGHFFFYILPPDTRLSQSEYVLCTEEFEEY